MSGMILVALGANKVGPWGGPEAACRKALAVLQQHGVAVVRCSPFYRSAPMGPPNQPDYVNAVALLRTASPPLKLLQLFKDIERAAGRGKGRRWGARELDLDLLAYHRRVIGWPGAGWPAMGAHAARPRLVLPHPELNRRPFVLRPLCDIAPEWHHPVTGETAIQMWRKLKARLAR